VCLFYYFFFFFNTPRTKEVFLLHGGAAGVTHTHTKTGGRSPLPFSLVPFFHQDFLFFFFLPFHLRLVEKISSFFVIHQKQAKNFWLTSMAAAANERE
jgi:hypothetical protein